MNLVIFGPNGSGKGTQGAVLQKRFAVAHVESGAIFRAHAAQGTELGARATLVQQSGQFQTELQERPLVPPPTAYGEDSFTLLDAFVGYRLPNRRGLLSLTADNLLDEAFQYQDVEPNNPSLFPESVISFRFTLAFE